MKGFRHRITLRVRNYQVDWQGIVHNAVYLEYFETGRIEYLRGIGQVLDLASINRSSRVVLARNEIDYLHPARFDNRLEVSTGITQVGTSSFVFEGIIRIRETDTLIAKNRAVHVWLHPKGGYPIPVPPGFIRRVEAYEKRKIPRKIRDL